MKIAKDPAEAGSIVDFLLGGERCVCEMTGPLDVSQPLVSHHLAFLRDAGLVRMRDEGARTYYSIDWDRFDDDLRGFLGYIERLRNAPPDLDRTESDCATVAKEPAPRRVSCVPLKNPRSARRFASASLASRRLPDRAAAVPRHRPAAHAVVGRRRPSPRSSGVRAAMPHRGPSARRATNHLAAVLRR